MGFHAAREFGRDKNNCHIPSERLGRCPRPNDCLQARSMKSNGKPRELTCWSLLIDMPNRYADGSPLIGRTFAGEGQIVGKLPRIAGLPVDPRDPAEVGGQAV